MTAYKIQGGFDLIIAHGTLHLVTRDEWSLLIDTFKSHTLPHGFNVITVFTDEIAAPPDMRDVCVGVFEDGELFERYADWQCRLTKSYTFHDEHPGGLQHLHSANKLVARKPGNT
jgi:tellurite methyltransferase